MNRADTKNAGGTAARMVEPGVADVNRKTSILEPPHHVWWANSRKMDCVGKLETMGWNEMLRLRVRFRRSVSKGKATNDGSAAPRSSWVIPGVGGGHRRSAEGESVYGFASHSP